MLSRSLNSLIGTALSKFSFVSNLTLTRHGNRSYVNVRGNLVESFGSLPTAMLLIARSCIFSDNQCFLDNSGLAPLPRLAVSLGVNPKVPAGSIIASGNFVQVPVPVTQTGGSVTVMSLNPASVAKNLTVLGNITSGLIVVDGTPLGALTTLPWAPLNVINI